MDRRGHDRPLALAELSVYRTGADSGTSRDAQPWRVVQSDSGGGILLDHGTHLLYSLFDLAGEPRSVRAWTGRLRHHGYGVEDSAQLVIQFDDRLSTLFLTWAASHRENRVRIIGERGTIDWLGGILTLERDAGRAAPQRVSHDFSAQLDKRAYAGWFTALFRTFADALDRGEADAALDDITRIAAVLEAAYESAPTGCQVDVSQVDVSQVDVSQIDVRS